MQMLHTERSPKSACAGSARRLRLSNLLLQHKDLIRSHEKHITKPSCRRFLRRCVWLQLVPFCAYLHCSRASCNAPAPTVTNSSRYLTCCCCFWQVAALRALHLFSAVGCLWFSAVGLIQSAAVVRVDVQHSGQGSCAAACSLSGGELLVCSCSPCCGCTVSVCVHVHRLLIIDTNNKLACMRNKHACTMHMLR
jgi:hypothetical protein